MFPIPLYQLADETLAALRKHGMVLGTVESCTGGLIGATFTEVPGSSDVFFGGLITYSNALKATLTNVPSTRIEQHGAVSEPVARAMAEGGKKALGVDWCIAVTGVAGPGGGSEAKPVGTVHIAIAGPNGTWHERCHFVGDRTNIRLHTAHYAISQLAALLASMRAVG